MTGLVLGACALVVPAVAAPLAIALSKPASRFVSPGHIYEDWFFGDPAGLLNLAKITSSKQLETLPSMTDFYNKRLVIGSYSEQREFYTTLSTDAYHYGMDILVGAGTPVYAPYDGELIYATFVNKSEAITSANEGLGGIAVLRVKVDAMDNLSDREKSDLLGKLNDSGLGKDSDGTAVDFVYIQMLHMGSQIALVNGARTTSGKTGSVTFTRAAGVSAANPLPIKQGSLLGFVGSIEENGGWAPHIHYQVMNPANEKTRKSTDGKVSPTGIIRFANGEPDSLSTLRVVGVGPKANITNGTILDANLLIKVLKTAGGSYKIPPTVVFATTYTIIDPAVAKDIVVSLPFQLGSKDLPLIARLPDGPENFAAWSAPAYARSGNKSSFDPTTLQAGDKFTATYTRTTKDGTSESYKLTATYTAVEKKLTTSFFATYFFTKGQNALPENVFEPGVLDNYEPWQGPVYARQANSVFDPKQISAMTAGSFTATLSSSPILLNERYVVNPS